jgi:signal transduction histidine kinase
MAVETKPENAAPAVYRLPIDPTAEHASSASSRAEVDRVLLRRNAVWFCGLRWIVVGLLLAAAGAACFPSLLSALGVRLDYGWPLATAVALGVLNSVYVLLIPSEHARLAQVRLHLWVQIIADLVILTVVVHFLGSVETAAPFMYLFHIILACVFFPPSQSLAVAATAVLLYCGCLALESAGVVRPATVVENLRLQTWDRDFFSGRFWSLHMGPLLAIWGVIWYVASRLSGALRKREAELAITNVRLKASSEERTRHMLQTTHELKAPFAAIHANAQILLSGTCGSLPDEAKGLVERIAARCTMLSQQILDMLQLSNLHSESQETLSPMPMDLAESLRGCIARVQPAAGLRGISIKAELEPVVIAAVEDHLRMLFDNLLTNAVHYSHDGGAVEVTCRRQAEGMAQVVIRDHGIGIPAEKLPHIFEEFYRTREAVRHNKASTGLGLAIVRDVARMGGIQVQVESRLSWGTRVTLTIPMERADRSKISWHTF